MLFGFQIDQNKPDMDFNFQNGIRKGRRPRKGE